MSIEGEIGVWDILESKFKGKGVEEKVQIEYEKVKGDRWDRGNMGVEFNGNKVRYEEMVWLKENIIEQMEDEGFRRVDLGFDFEDDLRDQQGMSDK